MTPEFSADEWMQIARALAVAAHHFEVRCEPITWNKKSAIEFRRLHDKIVESDVLAKATRVEP